MRRLILPLLLTAAVTLTVPAVAQSRVRLTAGRMKHQIFHVLRHSADFGYLYDEGRIHGPVYKICWNWTRTWGGCAWYGPRFWYGAEIVGSSAVAAVSSARRASTT